MASLIAKSPCAGLVPVEVAGATLTEWAPEAITSVAPFKGQDEAVSAALKEALGAGLPMPGRAMGKESARVLWSGLGQALVLGPRVELPGAAVTDQSDAWACLVLEGPEARAVLARLCPLDLRPEAFRRGHVARSLLGHMNAVLHRAGAERYELLVFRSMARTAVHELSEAMTSVAAQSARAGI